MAGLIAVGILLQITFAYMEHTRRYLPAVILKGGASACFVLLGATAVFFGGPAADPAGRQFRLWLLTGLAWGMAGDILMNLRLVFPKVRQILFVLGTLSFLAGNLLYMLALLSLSPLWWLPLSAGLALSAVLLRRVLRRITLDRPLAICGLFYVGPVSVMAVAAVWNALACLLPRNSLPVHAAGLFLLAPGAVLFLASDLVLVLNSFGGRPRKSLWITNLTLYYLAQLLIAGSLTRL